MRKREAAVLKGDDQRGGLGYDAHAHRNGCAKFVVKASGGLGHLHHFWRWHFPVASAQPPQNYNTYQKRFITITGDEMKYINPTPATGGGTAMVILKRAE